MKIIFRVFMPLLFGFLMPNTIIAGPISDGFDNFKINHIGIEDGLSNNSVTSIYQDHKGFMWIGTYDGLNRYDGYDFQIFRNHPEDSTSLINNRIVSIYGSESQIWIGTKKGISIYDYLTGKFKRRYSRNPLTGVKQMINTPINEIKGIGQKIYVATAGKGLMEFSSADTIGTNIPLKIEGKELTDYHAQGFDFDDNGRMWVFVQGYGIAKLERGSGKLELVFSEIKSGTSVIFDKNSNLWIGLDNGLLRYNISDNSHFVFSQPIIRFQVKDLMFDEDKDVLWAATDGNGVIQYNIERNIFSALNSESYNEYIDSNSVYALFRDDENRKWIGALRGGINIITDEKSPFKTIAKQDYSVNSLSSNYILSFCEQVSNKIWIGTDGGGASLWNRNYNSFQNFKHDPHDNNSLSNDFVTAIEKGNIGIWFGTYGGGVCLYDINTKKFKKYNLFNEKTNSFQNNIWVLYTDLSGTMWAASSDGEGLYKYDSVNDSFDFINAGISGIISFIQDQNGTYWAGTFGQLIKLDLLTMNHTVYEIGYPVRSIYSDTDIQGMLIGTEGGGLINFNPTKNTTINYTESSGLPNNSILNILRDDNGLFWLSTYNGISRFNLESGLMVNYFDDDGLQSNQFNYNAAIKISSGELLMGGIKGFNVINPDVKNPVHGFPNLLISEINVNNVPISEEGKTSFAISSLELPFNKSMLSIDFVALEYNNPGKISYAYYLEGWDSEWHYVGNSRVANYSKLPEGDYIFKIKSTNRDGIWNSSITSLPILIFPPWYRSVFAYIIYFILTIVVIYAIIFYQKKQSLLRYQIQLSEDRAEHENELNEKKFNFFTNISHEFRAPLTMIINPLKEIIYGKNHEVDPAAIEVVYRNSRRLLSLVDQLLLFRKAESDTGDLKETLIDLVSISKEVFTCFLYHAKTKKIEYVFDTNVDTILMYVDKEKIEIALFNLISNALKYTDKELGVVRVNIGLFDENVILEVKDNGGGIKNSEKEKIFDLFYQTEGSNEDKKKGFGIGLYLVKKFVEKHDGNITCKDNEIGGTTFSIQLAKCENKVIDTKITKSQNNLLIEELTPEKKNVLSQARNTDQEFVLGDIVQKFKTIIVIDDNTDIRNYVKSILSDQYHVLEAENAEEGIKVIRQTSPDLIISDVLMGKMTGIELCELVKKDAELQHIPIILLTAGSSEEIKLKGIEVGADDYITKPFDKDYLIARIKGILKRRETVEHHLLNKLTGNIKDQKLSKEDKELLDHLEEIIESKMEENGFNIKMLAGELGMSHSLMYKKIKQITGKSASEFVRFIKLRKVATLLITTNIRINQAVPMAGFSDLKYFRKQFQQQFKMNPSEFKKKYKSVKDKKYILNESFWKSS